MELRLERKWPKAEYTVGRLYIDGELFCNTLEDKVADVNRNGKFDGTERKVPGKTAIPYGTYRIFYGWSPRFGRNLPRLLNVTAFEGILIHPGNTAEDSSGCILVGRNTEVGRLTQSRLYSDELIKRIDIAQRRGEQITIEIV